MREIITTGKTLDEAIETACSALGVSRDQVNCEIITMPRRRLFKFEPAKVRVSVTEDDFSVKDLLMESEKPQQSEQNREAAPEKKENSSGKRRRSKKPAHKEEPKQQPAPAPVQEPKEQPAEQLPAEVAEEPEEEIALDALPVGAAAAFEYLKAIAAGLGANSLTYKAVKIKDGVKFVIDGDDAATLIGRRGETMDSLQYLCLLVSNRAGEDYCKITLDVAGYRSKRERTLEALAQKVARKVIKTRYSQTLEPMNPYERRIVHSTIQNIEGVKSESVGQDPNRRIVVSLISGGKDSGRGSRGGRNSSRRDGGRNDRDRKPREPREPRNDSREQAAAPRELNLEAAPKEYQRIDEKPQKKAEPKPRQAAAEKKDEGPKNLNLYQKIEL